MREAAFLLSIVGASGSPKPKNLPLPLRMMGGNFFLSRLCNSRMSTIISRRFNASEAGFIELFAGFRELGLRFERHATRVADFNLPLPLIWRKDNAAPLLAKFVTDVQPLLQ